MVKKVYRSRIKSKHYRQELDDHLNDTSSDDADDDYLLQFWNFLFDELLERIKAMPYAQFINNILIYDGETVYRTMQSLGLEWLYTANGGIHGIRTYSFRFPNACHPDGFKSFHPKSHPNFVPSNHYHRNIKGWYEYIGRNLPGEIAAYLKITTIMNGYKRNKTKIFVNIEYERIDMEFYFQSDNVDERITITFEPAFPA